jgi:hypothetical protein
MFALFGSKQRYYYLAAVVSLTCTFSIAIQLDVMLQRRITNEHLKKLLRSLLLCAFYVKHNRCHRSEQH